jgi:hypothetical protein
VRRKIPGELSLSPFGDEVEERAIRLSLGQDLLGSLKNGTYGVAGLDESFGLSFFNHFAAPGYLSLSFVTRFVRLEPGWSL